MYELDELIKIFEENALMAKKENDVAIEAFKNECPDQPLPEWFTRDFCINTALAAICKAILKIDEDLHKIWINQN